MKKLIFLLAFVSVAGWCRKADAQLGVTVNIGSQPVWGPAGYDYAEYYYFPETDVYYHVPDRQFIYPDRGSWISAYALPPYYRNFDLYNSYKVVINEARPYARNDYWHSRYYAYRGQQQEIIYNSRQPKYFVLNEHPQHSQWMESRVDNRGYNNRAGNFGRPGVRNDQGVVTSRWRQVDGNARDRNDVYRSNNDARSNDNNRWNQNNRRDNQDRRFYGNRRN